MTITLVSGQIGGAASGTALDPTFAFAGNVTLGNTVLMQIWRYSATTASPLTLNDMVKSAGTSTLGTIAKDSSASFTSGAHFFEVGVYSASVSGTGTLTVKGVHSDVNGDVGIGAAEFNSTTGTIAFVATTNVSACGANASPLSPTATTTGNSIWIGIETDDTSASVAHTVGAGYTRIFSGSDGNVQQAGIAEYKLTAASTTTATATLGGTQNWLIALAGYQEPAGSGSTTTTQAPFLQPMGIFH